MVELLCHKSKDNAFFQEMQFFSHRDPLTVPKREDGANASSCCVHVTGESPVECRGLPCWLDGTGEGSHTEGSKSWKDEWRGSRRTRSEKDKWVGREAHPFPILMRTTGLSRKGDGSPPFSQAERPPNKTAFLFTSTRLMSLAFLSVGS